MKEGERHMLRFKKVCSTMLALTMVFTIILNSGATVFAAQEDPIKGLQKLLAPISKNEALLLAGKYYKQTYLKVESDVIEEFRKAVPKQPVFDGKNTDPKFAAANANDIALLINYTNAKNFYLAFASANFSYDPSRINIASDLAAAIATYYDELFYANMGSPSKEKEFYSDAVKLYSYALSLGIKDGKYSQDCLPAMSSLGNLFLDMNKFEEAHTAFKAALAIDNSFWPARQGLYNYYMAKKEFKKAFDLIAEDAEFYPSIAKAVRDISKNFDISDDTTDMEGGELSDEASEKKLEELNAIPAVTSGDFIKYIDPAASAKVANDIKNMQAQLKYTAPDISFLTQYSSYQTANSVKGRAAYEALAHGINVLHKNTIGKTVEVETIKKNDMLNQFGINIEIGGGIENLEELINDAIANPEKYENYDPEIKVTGIEGIESKAQEYVNTMSSAISKAENTGDSEDVFRELSKTRPEYKIMLINPYKYINTNDILLQRSNVLILGEKRIKYASYLTNKNTKTAGIINDIMMQYQAKTTPILLDFERRIKKIDDSNMSEAQKVVARHRVHVEFFSKLNRTGEPYWNQATQAACVAYKKIEKYSAQMYNDCMKHITMICDPKIREKLEEEIRTETVNSVIMGMTNVLNAYGFAPYKNIAECSCDPEYIRQMEKQIHEEANEQIKRNIQAKKNFDDGVLDENSKYYKNFIEKYEVNYNYIFFRGKISPYKSYDEFSLGAFGTGVFKKTVTNHIKNTTTSESGLSVGFKRGPVGARGYVNFRSSTDSKGTTVSDTTFGAETSAELGPASAQANFEYNTVRGTRMYTKSSVSGDPFLDKLKLEVAGNEIWKPDLKLPRWDDSYDTGWSNVQP